MTSAAPSVSASLVVDDSGRSLLAAGGSLTLQLASAPGSTQRFILSRYATMHALGQAICATLSRTTRISLRTYEEAWLLRDRHTHTPLDPALLVGPTEVSPQAAGLRHGAALELVML